MSTVPDTITMPAADARALAYHDDVGGWTVVANYPTGDTSRWAHWCRLVIRNDAGEYYATEYQIGDGDQGEGPWEYEDQATFLRVVPREKTVIEYVRPEHGEDRADG